MVQCKKCNKNVSLAKDDFIKCKGTCDLVFHKKCITKTTFKNEKCEDCVSALDSPSLDDSNLRCILAEMNRKMDIIYNMEKKLSELTDLVDFISEKYDKLCEHQVLTEKKIKALENKNEFLEKCNKSLEERVNDLEEVDREKKVELCGLEKKNNEDITKVVVQMAQKLQLESSEIEHAERVGREKPGSEKPPPVVVTLKTKAARNEWIGKRKTNLTNGQIYGTPNENRVYINENLTRYKRSLLWSTKIQLKKTHKYIWVQDGKILIRKSDDQKKIMSIRNESDIQKIVNNDPPFEAR
ncbi:uncharacterized protein LOC113507429 [Trichoplusia ni]|uniref:Uncharacterized protein LOC113507429 n=1 Tax=Trichoplusia ni TaxID=7111 RepID=A0A7E5X0T3_TRINI|nr:uncharacterized protein LOC113507429 [Trichoplusia ni]